MSGAATEIDEQAEDLGDEIAIPEGKERHDPRTYVRLAALIDNRTFSGKIKAVNGKQMQEMLANACLRNTGIALEDAAKEDMDVLQRFEGLMETGELELLAVERSVQNAEKLSGGKKKSYVDVIRRTIALQQKCRPDPMLSWIYIGRTSERGEVFEMSPIHRRFFDVWNDPSADHSLVMAPPGHSKTTSLRGQIVWELGDHPELRCLLIFDAKPKAQSEVNTVKRIMRSPRFRAIFPGVRVLNRTESGEDSSFRFYVSRPNWMSREPSIEGAAILSRINGNGYDRIFADDICSPEVRDQPRIREDCNRRWDDVISQRLREPKRHPRIRLIHTPWHENDVSGRVRRMAGEGLIKGWKIAIDEFAIKDDAKGKAIPVWDHFTTEFFEEQKIKIGAGYTLNYRLKPRQGQDRIVAGLHFYNGTPDKRHDSIMRKNVNGLARKITDYAYDEALCEALKSPDADRQLSIDPAATAGRTSSDTGIVEFVLTPKGYAYLTQTWALHEGPVFIQTWIVDQIFKAIDEGQGYSIVWIEAQGAIKGMANLWEKGITAALKEKNCPNIPRIMLPGVGFGRVTQNPSKIARLKECSGYLQNGLVTLAGHRVVNALRRKSYCQARPGTEMAQLAERIINFDPGSRTDGVDAVTQVILKNRDKIRNPFLKTPEPPKAAPVMDWKTQALRERMDQVKRDRVNKGQRSEEHEFLVAQGRRSVA